MPKINYPSFPLCPKCGKLQITCVFCGLRLTVDFEGAEKLDIYCPQCSTHTALTNPTIERSESSQPVFNPSTEKREDYQAAVVSLEKIFKHSERDFVKHPISYYVQKDFDLPKGDILVTQLASIARSVYKKCYGQLPHKNKSCLYAPSEWELIKLPVLQRLKEVNPQAYSSLFLIAIALRRSPK